MARVQYIAPIQELNGSLGGTTFQRNRSGFICRARPVKCNSLSYDRNVCNSLFFSLVGRFQSLSETNKNLWKDFSIAYTFTNRYGLEKNLTAFNWFVLINSNMYNIDGGTTDTPLPYELPDAVTSYSLSAYSNTLIIDFTSNPSQNLDALFIMSTPPIRRLTTSFRGKLKLTQVQLNNDQISINITDSWKSVHGLNYPPSSSSDRFSVGVCLCSVRKGSGISSPYLCSNSAFTNVSGGIGDMVIDNDFVVS